MYKFNPITGKFDMVTGFEMIAITGADGVETYDGDGVLTGRTGTLDFALPTACDINKPIVALNPAVVEATALLVAGVKTVRFTIQPLVGETPIVLYNT